MNLCLNKKYEYSHKKALERKSEQAKVKKVGKRAERIMENNNVFLDGESVQVRENVFNQYSRVSYCLQQKHFRIYFTNSIPFHLTMTMEM